MKRELSAKQRVKAMVAAGVCGVYGERRGVADCLAAALTGHWEGTESDRYRHRPTTKLESVDIGIRFGGRDEYISEARRLDQTFGIVGAIKEKYAQHVVGACRLVWNTGDDAINSAYRDLWNNSLNTLDASGAHHGTKMTELMVKAVIGDGAMGTQIINQPGRPVQLRQIERDRIRNTAGLMDMDQPDIFGGIKIDRASGKRIAFRVWDRNFWGIFENPREIPAGDFIFVYDPDRIDDVGGVTKFKNVINPLTDLKETVEAEHLSVKRNSKLALLVKTIGGGARTVADKLFQGDGETDGQGSENVAQVNSAYVNNAVDAYMFPDEEMRAHESNRPSNGWLGLMEWRVHEIAVALHLPVAIVWKLAMGSTGPIARGDYTAANKTFSKFHYQVVWLAWLRKIAGIVIARGISDGTVPFHPKWTNFRSIRPPSITIDNGRDTRSELDAIDAGVGSIEGFFDEAGEDPHDTIDSNIELLSYMKTKAEAKGLTFEDARRPHQTTASTKISQSNAQQQTA